MTAISGTFANFRIIKTRSVAVLEIEVAIEKADAALAALGGLPKPGAEQWVALAPLKAEAAVEHDRKAQAQPPAEPLERKPLALASKVALTCGEASFQRFLAEERPNLWRNWWQHAQSMEDKAFTSTEIASLVVRTLCMVASRSEITIGSDAAKTWLSLEADYHHWQRTGAAA